MLEVTRAEAKAVRIFIVEAGCLKMPKTVALKTGLPIAGMVRCIGVRVNLPSKIPYVLISYINSVLQSTHSAS